MDLFRFWNKKVSKEHKHFVNKMSKEKMEMHIERSKRNLLDFVNFSEVDIILDWGCGGGVLANTLFNYGKVAILDIAQSSLDACKLFVGNKNRLYDIILFSNDPKHFEIPKYNIDLIWSCAVIHHFPSFDYWLEIVRVWNKISPRYITIQIKLGKECRYKDNYFNGNNYTEGLILSLQNIYEAFPLYDCINFVKERAKYSNAILGFFVLKRKE